MTPGGEGEVMGFAQAAPSLAVADEAKIAIATMERVLAQLSELQDDETSACAKQLQVLVDASISACCLLWQYCQASDATDDVREQVSAVACDLSARLLRTYLARVRALEQRMLASLSAQWAGVLLRSMTTARWSARWSWLRYERPSEQFWAFCAYIYENAERGGVARTESQLVAGQDPVSIEMEYLALLFAQWINPLSLSPTAYFLVERVVDSCRRDLSFSPLEGPDNDEIVDLDTGRVVLPQNAIAPRRKSRHRYVPLGRLRDRVRAQLLQVSEDRAASVLLDAIAQISRTVIGHQQRHLVRLGYRTNIVRTVHATFGYEQIMATWEAADAQVAQPWGHECMLRDRSIQGCRLFVPFPKVRIGMLVAVAGVFGAERALGVIRWLTRAGTDSWEAGVWLLRGTISVLQAQPQEGLWPEGQVMHPVMVVDTEEAEYNGLTLVLPKHSCKAQCSAELITPQARLRFLRRKYLESGVDFDLGLYVAEEIA